MLTFVAKPELPKNQVIYVVNHGWHTGVVIPVYAFKGRLDALSLRFSQAAFIELGWRDRGFYQAKKNTSKLTVLRMIFAF